ncbi:MAG TPA: ferredoxin [Actinoplanes sp.]|jgi:ferredoxin
MKLLVDPVACDGIGMCSHLAPALVNPDSWGYPIVSGETLGETDLRAARAAVAACPRRALLLDDVPRSGRQTAPVERK